MVWPLVSIIVSNYNYGRYLKDAVTSAKSQTYGRVECIVVDDCSTDNSSFIMDEMVEEWPDLRLIRSSANGGQSSAILLGLSVCKGDFVLLLDADDILLPDCVASHLSVHYSSRVAVGFTCCDSLQLVDGVMAGGRNGSLSKAFLTLPAAENIVSSSPLERLSEEGLELPRLAYEALRYVSWKNLTWPWSTTSCMLFRKSVLEFVCAADGFHEIRIGSDNYIAQVVNFLTGSIVCDKQLVKYRIHGRNGFSRRLHLNGLVAYNRADDHTSQTIDVLLGDLEARFQTYLDLIDSPARLVLLVALLNCLSRYAGRNNVSCRSLEGMVTRNRATWSPLIGSVLFEEMLEAATSADPMKLVGAWSDELPVPNRDRLSDRVDHISKTGQDGDVSLSPSTINAVAMEVWFERQRWSWPYKLGKWLGSRHRPI